LTSNFAFLKIEKELSSKVLFYLGSGYGSVTGSGSASGSGLRCNAGSGLNKSGSTTLVIIVNAVIFFKE
jgi:hypothetical protein